MKEWAHLGAALVLAVISLTITSITQISDTTRPLDTARFYTMRWVKPDTASALHQLKDLRLWKSDQCQTATNLSSDPACIEMRQEVRDNILGHMKCTQYGSQVCSYIRLALKALIRTSTTERVDPANQTSPFKSYGANLKSIATPKGEKFKDILQTIINDAPQLFHGAFRAEESDKTLVLRSALYNLIVMAILGNLVVHIVDSFELFATIRFLVRALSFIIVLLTAFVFLILHTGNALVISLILVTAFVNLVYFEMFLDPTIVRPWIHPFVFGVIYMSTTVLALVENGILDYNLIVIHMLLSMAGSQMFMSMAWYFVGFSEKLRLTDQSMRELCQVYLTKETQLALLGSIVMQVVIPLHQVLAPYNYTYNSVLLAISPILFSILALLSTIIIQSLHLDDEYGQDMILKEDQKGWNPGYPFATVITGGKLYASLLLLLFGAVISMIFMVEHIQTYRAFLDTMPENSIQFDDISSSRKYLMGQGLSLLSVI